MKIKLSLLLFFMCVFFNIHQSHAQDFDNDSVIDITDQDDDNDGILDIDDGSICFTTPRLLSNSVATASASGSGQSGVPSISYDVPNGVNRMMLVVITVERDHTLSPYGDNWESDWPISQNPADRQLISYGGVPLELDRLRYTYNYFVAPVNPVANIPANAEHSSTSYVYKMFEDTIPEGLNAFDFSDFNLPNNAGDEFSVIVSTYEGVADFQQIGVNSFPRSTTPTWSLSGDALSPSQNPGTTEDQNLLLAYGSVGTQNGTTASTSWTNIASSIVRNSNGTYISDLNTGENPGTEDDGISGGLYSLSGVTGNQSITFTTSLGTSGVFHKHIMLYRLMGFAITDTDNDGLANCVDIDSDNDGIPDNVEAQPSLGYIIPSLVVNPITGINPAYPLGLTPVDTDGDGTPDYIDLNSDNDTLDDIEENGDVNTISGNDTDQDGLDDNFDSNNATFDTNDEVTTGTPANLIAVFGDTDSDLVLGGDLDYRDIFDIINPPSSATIDFDGIDDYVEAPNSVINDIDEFTISFWIKPEALPTGGILDTRFILGQKDRFEIELGNNAAGEPQIWAKYSYGPGPSTIRKETTINSLDWVHYTAVVNFNADTITVYKNGEDMGSEVASNTPLTNSNPLRMGSKEDVQPSPTSNFNGWLDEVRIFNGALTAGQIQQMVYQEVKENGANLRGTIIDKDIVDISTSTIIPWTNLLSYYPMTNIFSGKVVDASSYDNDAILFNITSILEQTAPMPYQTAADGVWGLQATWLHGDVWDIEDIIGNKPWSIANIKHDIVTVDSHQHLGMLIDEGKSLTVLGEKSITNTWYLQLDGTLDLEGDSQLIQTEDSDLVTSATGKILRRQEGNSNVFWYNYWSSPVGSVAATTLSNNNSTSNNANNTTFSIDMIKDGTGASIPFTTANNDDGMISNQWLFSYQNGQTFWDWTTLTTDSSILPGVGYTQKGTGNGGEEQHYIFDGKPNNGTILIQADDLTDAEEEGIGESEQDVTFTSSFIGNPYPSAIDARKFIADNDGVTGGSVYVWEQWGGTNHILEEYQGGYGTISNFTTERAYQFNDPNQTESDSARKPTFYIPVAQGFFVEVVNDGNNAVLSSTDDIEFNNGQRVFIKESDADTDPNPDPNNGSVFFRNTQTNSEVSENSMGMIRLELNVSNGNKRSFVLAFSEETTDEFDYGYDARTIDPQDDDLNSFIGNEKMLIQSFSPIIDDKVVDLIFNSTGVYDYTLEIIEMINIPEGQEIYLRDNLSNTYFNLRTGVYSFSSVANGEDSERFDVVFQDETLSTDDVLRDNVIIYVNDSDKSLYIKGLDQNAKTLTLTNMLGQTVKNFRELSVNSLENGLFVGELSYGVYLVNLVTNDSIKIDKKIIIK